MQTFLPYKDFNKSAQALDNKRLNKQILEGYQILKVLSNPDPKAAWRNHPAVKMWRNAEHTLFTYVNAMVREADIRGIKTDKNVANLMHLYAFEAKYWGTKDPAWIDNDATMKLVTTTHQANLYRKDPEYYAKFVKAFNSPNNKPCCDTCQYYWVTHKENV